MKLTIFELKKSLDSVFKLWKKNHVGWGVNKRKRCNLAAAKKLLTKLVHASLTLLIKTHFLSIHYSIL